MKKISCLIILALLILGCSDDRKFVGIALKKDHKVYLMPTIADKDVLEHQLSENMIPSVSSFVQIVEDEGALFVEPRDFERVLNLIANNYILYERKEKTHDGYVVFGDNQVYSYSINHANTDKIGKQISLETIVIKNNTSHDLLEIVWTSFPKPRAEKNCTIKRIWVVTSPHPGTTIGNYEETVLINLNEIVDFYGNGVRLEHNEKEGMLYILQ
ncbi:hypothetical protein D2V93_01545 [Flagellimonas taeanensis]|uniref:hypothetical protein n=1 Tax=Flavobacteriaceae TaxID=49546 RepID=UPI000E68BA5D|nr:MULTISPECIES: hypothetical protein [Allomuricauda]MDC6384764.1 hypothetical protein [Muricauda sp. SK9]RIV53498.1 hypothetical protein D2V93_01545 [Allomuricauda taeanensis]